MGFVGRVNGGFGGCGGGVCGVVGVGVWKGVVLGGWGGSGWVFGVDDEGGWLVRWGGGGWGGGGG